MLINSKNRSTTAFHGEIVTGNFKFEIHIFINHNDAFPVIVRYVDISCQLTALHPVWTLYMFCSAPGCVLDFWSILVVFITYDDVPFVGPLIDVCVQTHYKLISFCVVGDASWVIAWIIVSCSLKNIPGMSV